MRAQAGETATLSHLLYVGSNIAGFEHGIEYLEQAIAIDHSLTDSLNLAHHLVARAFSRAQFRRINGLRPVVTPEVEADFTSAETAIAHLADMEAREVMANILQQRGIHYFIDQNWDLCGNYLTRAEEWCRQCGFKSHLAYTLSHQGLVFIQRARQGDVAFYDLAREKLNEARSLFHEIPVAGEQWRVAFHLGLCPWEIGQRLETDSEARITYFQQAEAELREAARQLDNLRSYAALGSLAERQRGGIGFGVDKQTVYDTGMQVALLGLDDHSLAFEWLERLKSRAFLDTLSDLTPPEPALTNNPMIREEMALRETLFTTADPRIAVAIQRDLDALAEKMIHDPALRDHARMRLGEVASWPLLRAQLKEREKMLDGRRLVLLEYWCHHNSIWAVGLRADWESPRFQRLDLDLDGLTQTLRQYFHGKNSVRLTLEDFGETAWMGMSSLLAPLAEWAATGDIVGFIPFGILHDVPLHTLLLDAQPCILRHPCFYAPSASVLAVLWKRPLADRQPVAVLGNPTLDLPLAAEEARYIARQTGSIPRLENEVDLTALQEALASMPWVHFAGHAFFDPDDGFKSHLKLAKDATLSAQEILLLDKVRTQTVVLSGCETGRHQPQKGDENIGLIRALLYRQVRQVVASQWRVNDKDALYLLSAMYRYLDQHPNQPLALALQAAVRDYLDRFPGASFYHWAGFVLHGDYQ
ncbi:MAG TPA: CHAT domain-containing protein [Saprospiraceae bacterium]|nr:CHAT domain-containing protein [Saprospiraceae bacterium]